MSPIWYFLLAFLGVGLLLAFSLRYAERAIREKRPGWTEPPSEAGVRCPHAVGHKGDPGPPGQES